ncbi:MAG: hypothetical protein PHX04_02510 [Bacilli bacterium]|nr:hypothetical protein [Bacilli bacterium]
MEFIKENKKTLLICLSILITGLLIAYLIENKTVTFNRDLSTDSLYLKDYKINEVVPINMDETQIARKYLAEYVKLIYLDSEKAYLLLDEEYQVERFGSIKKFNEYFDDLKSDIFLKSEVKELSVSLKGEYKEFYIVDASGNVFIFEEYSIMQYKVKFA